MSAADTGAAVEVTTDGARPGWLCVIVQRPGRPPRRLWLATDEAAQLLGALGRALPPVTVTRRSA